MEGLDEENNAAKGVKRLLWQRPLHAGGIEPDGVAPIEHRHHLGDSHRRCQFDGTGIIGGWAGRYRRRTGGNHEIDAPTSAAYAV